MRAIGRRRLLGLLSGGATALAGCTGGGDDDAREAADVIAGPGGRAVFDPDEIAVEAGEPVTWYFDSDGHNVCGRPGDSERVALPSGAEPFASYGPGDPPGTLVPRGGTYEHAFSTPGTYVYVCIPHQSAGMVGRVRVE